MSREGIFLIKSIDGDEYGVKIDKTTGDYRPVARAIHESCVKGLGRSIYMFWSNPDPLEFYQENPLCSHKCLVCGLELIRPSREFL